MPETHPLRVGIIGTAQITDEALVAPARGQPGVKLCRVASRDADRARAFAEARGIPTASGDYADVFEAEDLDLVYIATPNAFHVEHAKAALQGGKSVLCEKPLAMTRAEAESLRELSGESQLLWEGFHYLHHPLAGAALDAVHSLGPLESVEVCYRLPLLDRGAIHWRPELGGGVTGNLGCYALHFGRRLLGEPLGELLEVEASREGFEVEHTLGARFVTESGARFSMSVSQHPDAPVEVWAEARGHHGRVRVVQPFLPQMGGAQLELETRSEARRLTADTRPTFEFQLEALLRRMRSEDHAADADFGLEAAIENAEAIERIRARLPAA